MILNNPIKYGQPGTIRDPMILTDNGQYFLVATSPEFWTGENPGVRLWRSDNLRDWEYVSAIIDSGKLAESCDFTDRFWAPELFKADNKYYCLFNAHNAEKTELSKGLRSFIATADNIYGPYTIHEKPLIESKGTTNDAHLFADDDGRIYLFYSSGNEILMNEFFPDTCTASENAITVIEKGAQGEWDADGVEGSFVVKRGGVYYHWYSSWTRGYEMGLSVTDSLSRPFKKCPINPIISGIGRETEMPYCGHNSCFTLLDGRDAIAFHVAGNGFQESLCINTVSYPITESFAPQPEIIL